MQQLLQICHMVFSVIYHCIPETARCCLEAGCIPTAHVWSIQLAEPILMPHLLSHTCMPLIRSLYATHQVLVCHPSGPCKPLIRSLLATHQVLVSHPSVPCKPLIRSLYATHQVLVCHPSGPCMPPIRSL